MGKEKKLQRKLQAAQAEHLRLLKKIEKTHAKLDTRGQDLRALETKLAQMEGELHTIAGEASENGTASHATLRPARLIFNQNAASVSNGTYSVEQIVECLRTHGIDAQVTLKTTSKVLRQSAREAVERGEELVIAAGGDGTIEKVMAQLVHSETMLGILPVGTMNNLARCLGVPLDLEDACALIGMRTARKIDVGCVNVHARKDVKYFLETAGLGLNAIAIPAGHKVKKGMWGELPDALRKIFQFKPTPVTVDLDDGQVIHSNSQLITVSNAPMTGMNFMIAPEAKMDDGWLDVAVYDEMGKADLLAYFLAARGGHNVDHSKVKKYRAKRVHIVPENPEPVYSDKDGLPDRAELDIKILSQALRVIVGKGIGLSFPVDVAPSAPPLAGPQTTNGHEGKATTPAQPSEDGVVPELAGK